MNRTTLLIISITSILSLIACYNIQKSKEKSILLTEKNNLSDDFLIKGGFWGPGPDLDQHGWGMYFKNNGKISLIYYGEGGGNGTGFYRIEANKLFLNYTLKDPSYEQNNGIIRENKICNLEFANGFASKFYISCAKHDNYYSSDYISENEELELDTLPVITSGLKRLETTSNVKLRKKPSISGEIISCSIMLNNKRESHPYLPKGTEVIAFAKKRIPDPIESWNNYWFYVNVIYDAYYGTCDNGLKFGWIYGEFLKPSLRNPYLRKKP